MSCCYLRGSVSLVCVANSIMKSDWNNTCVCVAFGEIKAHIMFLALEPVTLRAWCLEWIIYNSDITNSLLILCLANLRCQISLPNFKGWCGQRSGAEVMKWYSWTMWGIYQWAIDWWFAIGQSDLLHRASVLSPTDSTLEGFTSKTRVEK